MNFTLQSRSQKSNPQLSLQLEHRHVTNHTTKRDFNLEVQDIRLCERLPLFIGQVAINNSIGKSILSGLAQWIKCEPAD